MKVKNLSQELRRKHGYLGSANLTQVVFAKLISQYLRERERKGRRAQSRRAREKVDTRYQSARAVDRRRRMPGEAELWTAVGPRPDGGAGERPTPSSADLHRLFSLP